MPVQFIVGRAGSGKTTRTLDLIQEEVRASPLGRPIWLVVPRQATFEYERALVARLGAFSRVRVVSFQELGQTVLEEVGGVAIPQLSAAGRQMIIGRLLWRHHEELQYFASSARRPGLASAVDSLFEDFERSGKALDQLGDLVERFAQADARRSPSLHAKLADLRLLYDRYHAYVGADRLDPEKRRQEILRRLGRSPSLAGAKIYVDAFYEFTDSERRMLADAAAVAERMEINFTLPPDSLVLGDPKRLPDELSPFHRTERTYRSLYSAMQKAAAKIERPMKLTHTQRFTTEPLARVEAAFATFDLQATAADGEAGSTPITFIEAPDPRTEVRRVAAHINDLLRTKGMRRRDILVLTRRADDYLHLIHAAFAEHGIPFFADKRRPASHHALIRFIRAALWIARDRWSPTAVIALGKTELAGLTSIEADRLENRIREYGITASRWLKAGSLQYSRPQVAPDEDFEIGTQADEADEAMAATEVVIASSAGRDLNAIRQYLQERLGPLVDLLGKSGSPAPLRTFAVALNKTLEVFDVRGQIAKWIAEEAAKDPEGASEHEQVWSQVQELLQEMVEVLGDEEMHPAEFLETFESGLDGFDLALAPATLDQVLVGSVDRTRSLTTKVVFVLGLNRGSFPATHRDDSLLSGAERRELHRHEIDVDPDPSRRQLDERFLGYIAFTRASHQLILSRPEIGEGGAKVDPSEFWLALRRIVPEAPVESCRATPLQQLSTPRAVVATLLDWARQLEDVPGHEEPDPADWRQPLYNWLASRKGQTDRRPIDNVTDLAWPSLSYRNKPVLSDAISQKLFASPLTLSAAQLEAFAACPFQHFAAYGLKLARRSTFDITVMELSKIYHDVLKSVVDASIQQNRNVAELTSEQIAALVRQWIQPIASNLHGGRFLEEARGQYLVARVERMLGMVFGTLCEQLRRGQWSPMRVGVAFGTESAKLKCAPIDLPGGKTAVLRGNIDRVDLASDGGLAIYDYRMGDQRLSPADVFHGLTLRLLASAYVFQRAGLKYHGNPLKPVAALSSRLRRSLQDVQHPDDAEDPESADFLLNAKPRGVIRSSHVQTFDPNTTKGASPVVAFHYKQDGTFGFRDKSDVVEEQEFATLVDFVEWKVRDLASHIAIGEIDVAPYYYGDSTPCPRCDYRSVCRFESVVNPYRFLQPLKRDEAIAEMARAIGSEVDTTKGAAPA